MQTEIKTVARMLSALRIKLPVDFLSRLDAVDYLGQLEHVLDLAAGQRQRLGDLLRVAGRITPAQLDEALADQRRGGRKLGEILIEKGLLTEREKDAVLEFQKRQTDVSPVSSKFALGNILIANGHITPSQLADALHRQVASGRRVGDELIASSHATKRQVSGALRLQRKLIAYTLFVILGVAPLPILGPSAEEAQSSAAMQVSAMVIAKARLQTVHQAAQLKISDADVAHGYVAIPTAARFSVVTNSRAGYVLQFHPIGSLFESVQIDGLGDTVNLGADGGTIVLRGPLPPQLMHELSFRFALHPDTGPGTYPWPLQLSVRPL